jgi:branched-chain amino acid transport system permease protein
VIIGLPALKLRGLYLAVTTVAFALATTVLLLNRRYLGQFLPDEVDRPALLGVNFDDQRVAYYVALATVVLAAISVSRLRRSRSGRMLIAARDNEALASSIGVSLVRLRLSAFALSGFLAALAGVLFSVQQGGVQPEAFAPGVSVTLFTFTVIGGFGSIAGPFLGFGLLGILSLLSTAASTQLLISGFGGIALMRRVARRRRLIVPSLIADQKANDHERRAPIRPRLTRAGSSAFVPQRYQLRDQWLIAPDPATPDDISLPVAPTEELADA